MNWPSATALLLVIAASLTACNGDDSAEPAASTPAVSVLGDQV